MTEYNKRRERERSPKTAAAKKKIEFFFFSKERSRFNGKEENTCYTVMQQTKFLRHKKIKPHPLTSKTNAYCYSDENGEIKSGGEDSICAKGNLDIAL